MHVLCCVVVVCKSNPCKNGAICTKEEYGFRCMCMDYYEGTTCESKARFMDYDETIVLLYFNASDDNIFEPCHR